MIVSPQNPQEWGVMATFLKAYSHVEPSPDLSMIGWVCPDEQELKIVCGMQGFIGKVCQIHIAFAPEWKYTPKAMLHAVFNYAFTGRGRELLIGIVSSENKEAMRFDKHLGFSELFRLPGMHDDGADLVVLGMYRHECRYIQQDLRLVKQVGNA